MSKPIVIELPWHTLEEAEGLASGVRLLMESTREEDLRKNLEESLTQVALISATSTPTTVQLKGTGYRLSMKPRTVFRQDFRAQVQRARNHGTALELLYGDDKLFRAVMVDKIRENGFRGFTSEGLRNFSWDKIHDSYNTIQQKPVQPWVTRVITVRPMEPGFFGRRRKANVKLEQVEGSLAHLFEE